MHAFTFASPSILCPIETFMPKYLQAGHTWVSHNHYITPITSITSIGTPKGDKFLPAEANGSIAAIPSSDLYFNSVKHCYPCFLKEAFPT
jgi:hypothetical protein